MSGGEKVTLDQPPNRQHNKGMDELGHGALTSCCKNETPDKPDLTEEKAAHVACSHDVKHLGASPVQKSSLDFRELSKRDAVLNQTPHALVSDSLNELRGRVGDDVVEAAYCPAFADWLLWLESDDLLLKFVCGSPQNLVWAKSLLSQWREAGRPCPTEWPETQNLYWLRPARSVWPQMVRNLADSQI